MPFNADEYLAVEENAPEESTVQLPQVAEEEPQAIAPEQLDIFTVDAQPVPDLGPTPRERWEDYESRISDGVNAGGAYGMAFQNPEDSARVAQTMRKARAGEDLTHDELDLVESVSQFDSGEEIDQGLEEQLAKSTEGPVMAAAIGMTKAVGTLLAGFGDIPRFTADSLNKIFDTDVVQSPEFLKDISDSMQEMVDEASDLQQQHIINTLKDGKIAEAVFQTAGNAIGDAYGMLSAMGLLKISPGSAGQKGKLAAQSLARLRSAMTFGVVKGLGTKGDAEDRFNATLTGTLYMASTAFSPLAGEIVPDALAGTATKGADFFINSMVSLLRKERGFGLGGQYAEAAQRAEEMSKATGIDVKTLKIIVYAKIMGFDLGYALKTEGFKPTAGTGIPAEVGRPTRIDRTVAYDAVDARLSEGHKALDVATTPQERAVALDSIQAAQDHRAAIDALPDDTRFVQDDIIRNAYESRESGKKDVDYELNVDQESSSLPARLNAVPPKADGSVDMEARQRVLDEWKAAPENAEAVREVEGDGETLYHWTAGDFDAFDTSPHISAGAHFGTRAHADNFAREEGAVSRGLKGRLIAVKLDIRNPLRLPDLGTWSARQMLAELPKHGIDVSAVPRIDVPSQEEHRQVHAAIRKAITDAGYDGIVYKNLSESGLRGRVSSSQLKDSFIAFSPSQIRPSPLTLRPDGTLAGMEIEGDVLYHVGEMTTPSIRAAGRTGGVGEVFLTSQPDAWKASLGREDAPVRAWSLPPRLIAKESPSLEELTGWAIASGYLKNETVRKPDGTVVYELDNKTPLVRPTETDKGKALPFYEAKDPMRGGNQGKHLVYAYLKDKGYAALESKYSPDGHEVAVFDPSAIRPSSSPLTLRPDGTLAGREPQRTPIEQVQAAISAVPPKADGSVDMEAREEVLREWKRTHPMEVEQLEGARDDRLVAEGYDSPVLYRGDRPGKTSFTGAEDASVRLKGSIFMFDDPKLAKFYTSERTNYMRPVETMGPKDGLYAMQANMGRRVFTMDAKDANWSEIPAPKEIGGKSEYPYGIQVDDLAAVIKAKGYTGMIVKNVGDQSGWGTQYVVFSPEQVALRPSPLTLRPDGTLAGGQAEPAGALARPEDRFAEGIPAPYRGGPPIDANLWGIPKMDRTTKPVSAGTVSEISSRVATGDEFESILAGVEAKTGLGDAEVRYTYDPDNPTRFGRFSRQEGKVTIDLNWAAIGNDGTLGRMVLNHERTHGVLTELGLTERTTLKGAQRDAYDDLFRMKDAAEARQSSTPLFKKATFGHYYTNMQEFLAGAKTDLYFRSYLRSLDLEGKNALSRVWDIARDSLGIKQDTEADKAFGKLLNMPELQREVLRTREVDKRREKILAEAKKLNRDIDVSKPAISARRVTTEDVASFLDGEAAKRGDNKYAALSFEDAARRMRSFEGDIELLTVNEVAELLGQKSPTGDPGKRARAIHAEIQRRAESATEQGKKDSIALDKARGMKVQTEILPPDYSGDPEAAVYVIKGEQRLAEQRKRGRKFKASFLQQEFPDVPELFGMIEEFTGEKGTYNAGLAIQRGRQYYLNSRAAYTEWVGTDGYVVQDKATGNVVNQVVYKTAEEARAAAKPSEEVLHKPKVTEEDMRRLPEALWGEMAAYLEGKPENAPNLSEYWKEVGDLFRYTDKHEMHRERVKYNRVMKWAKTGKGKIAPEQRDAMQYLRNFYLDEVSTGNRPMEEFYDHVAKFVRSPESDVLVIKDYTPHRNKQSGANYSADDDVDTSFMAGKNIRDLDVDDSTPTSRRSQRALNTRQGEYNPLENNPLVEQHRNYKRHLAMFYLDQPINDAYAKVVYGLCEDGKTPANHLSHAKDPQSLLEDKTKERITRWMQSIVNINVKRERWEQVAAKARANHFKTIASRGNLLTKQWFQVFATGEGAGFKNADFKRGLDYVARNRQQQEADFMRAAKRAFGDDGDEYAERTKNEVLLGKKQMQKELYGEDLDVDWDGSGFWENVLLRPFSIATDNRVIDAVNKVPLLGGDDAASLNVHWDTANRYGSMKGWLKACNELVLSPIRQGKEAPSFESLQSSLKFGSFMPYTRRRLAEFYAKGEYKEFAFQVASMHTRQGQFVYDTMMRDLNEVSPMWRQINQYQAWSRGYTMNMYRRLHNFAHKDYMSKNPRTRQLGAAKLTAELISSAAVFHVLHGAMTGRLPEFDEETMDSEWDRWKRLLASSFDFYNPTNPKGVLNPYNQSLLSTPLTPLKVIEGGAASLGWSLRFWDKTNYDRNRTIKGPSQVVDAYVRGLDFMYHATYAGVYGVLSRFKDEDKGNEIIAKSLGRAAQQGNFFLENYCWALWRTGNMLDMYYPEISNALGGKSSTTAYGDPLRTRNTDWTRMLIQDFLVSKYGEVPDWWNKYKPMEQARDLYYGFWHLILGSNPPFPEEDDKSTGFMPIGADDRRQRRTSAGRRSEGGGRGELTPAVSRQ